jgi:ABC-type nitrate/sulfonate/bicarbonate transport system permease component
VAFGSQVTTRGLTRRSAALALELVVPAAIVVAWWLASSGSTSLYFPPLSKIVSAFRQIWLFSHVGPDAVPSLEHLAAGYLLATVSGVVVGVAIGLLPSVGEALAPILEALRAVPALALVPAAVLILGIGPSMQIGVIVSAAVWPVLLNTADGVRGIDPQVNDVARSYRIGWRDRLLRMVLRAASPQIVAGMRTALSIAVVMIVFSEMVGSTNGIGYQLLQSQRAFDIPGMWSAMILLGILGYLLNIFFRGFERGVLAWHRGMRGASD